ncbi:MAG: transposase zinc-binding domain-containing protein [Polyangiaceae bacterium]|nr:transposase zinc-binding domain-containing protein [Polyangiaceae bacterium]
MLLLADVVRRHGPAYRERFGAAVLPSHARALDDIARCRTAALGGHLAVCSHCDQEHILFHSCRNRACPRCGQDTTARWLARQRRLLLPVPYFHVVFTLPDELRRSVRSHQRALVGALFRAAFEAVAALARDDHFLGAQIGALAVLHTWTRTLEWHPTSTCSSPLGLARMAAPGARSRGESGDFSHLSAPSASFFRGRFRARSASPPGRAIASHPLGEALGRLRQARGSWRREGPRIPRPLRAPHRHVRIARCSRWTTAP